MRKNTVNESFNTNELFINPEGLSPPKFSLV